MTILTDEEKRSILFKAQSMAGGDKGKKWNLQELGAALRIIEKTLGRKWYQKSGKNLIPKKPTSPPSNYDFLLEKQKLPPITALLRGGLPESYARIVQFASFIKELWNQTNIEEKIREYEHQERRGDISFDHFNRFFFELKVAAFCKRKGLSVYFIPKQQKTTPDLKLTSPQGTTYIECKKKDPQTKLEKEISDRYQKIETMILNNMNKLKLNYFVEITFDKEIEDVDITPAVTIANQNFLKKSKYFKEYLGKISVEGKQLTDYNVVQSSKNIPELPDISIVQHFSWSAETPHVPTRSSDLFKLREIDVPIHNVRIVAIYSSFKHSKVQSILNSVKDASDQLLKSSGYGIVAIEVSLGKNAQAELQQVFDGLPTLVESMPHVSAVIFFIEQTWEEGEFINKRTIFHGYVNPSASKKLPQDIEVALKASDTTPYRSLLDD